MQLLQAILSNRILLLGTEVREEGRLVVTTVLGLLGLFILGLMALISVTGAIAILCWEYAPGAVLLVLSACYGFAAWFLALRLRRRLLQWQPFPASTEALQKDIALIRSLIP